MISKHRWLVSLVIIAVVVAISAVIICSNQVFPVGSPEGIGVVAVSDDSGGVIIVVHKDNTIYAQHIDSTGQVQWGEEGLFIAECPSGSSLTMIEDGLGGAVLSWYDTSARSDDRDDPSYYEPIPFYCRRITRDGQVIWRNEPVSSGRERFVISDGSGGVVIAWDNYSVYHRGLWDNNLRLQKIAADGSYLWGNDGLLVVSSSPFRPVTDEEKAVGIKGTSARSRPTYTGFHQIASNGEGGVFVFWDEEQETGSGGVDVYAQHLGARGEYMWPEKVIVADKRSVSAGTVIVADQRLVSAESDGSGGAIVNVIGTTDSISKLPFTEVHIGSDGTISGTRRYSPADITLSDGAGGSFSVRIEEDPPYGDPRERIPVYWINRLDSSGQPVWKEQKALPDDDRRYAHVHYTPDGNGGVIITWVLRPASGIYSDARARKIDSNGNIEWDEQGVPVFDIPGVVYQKTDTVLSDQSGGIIVIGRLGKSAVRSDMIYAQRLDADGNHVWGGGIRIDH